MVPLRKRIKAGGNPRSLQHLDVLAAMATNETEVSTGGFVGEPKRSGVLCTFESTENVVIPMHAHPGRQLRPRSLFRIALGSCQHHSEKKPEWKEQEVSPRGTLRTSPAVEACESITRGIEGQLRIKSRKRSERSLAWC